MATVYDFTVKDRKGNEVKLSDYSGKVLLIVNTATGCGFTPHYDPLEAMYKDLRDKGLEILDFPCNQFAGQAPGSEDEIHDLTDEVQKLTDKYIKDQITMTAAMPTVDEKNVIKGSKDKETNLYDQLEKTSSYDLREIKKAAKEKNKK